MTVAVAVLVSVGAVFLVLVTPRLRTAPWWHATVTPLASIIGSGFLVITPLLASAVGSWAPMAMLAIVLLAWWVGSAIRVSILEVEPALVNGASHSLVDLDRLSRIVLGFAYVISVAFYVRLMASFLLRGLEHGDLPARVLTTLVLAAIALVGWARGLHGMEGVETVAVAVNLAVIGGLLVGLVVSGLGDVSGLADAYQQVAVHRGWWDTLRLVGGMLLVVQGFETSRYLGGAYDGPVRVRSMRRAQVVSGVVYVVFVALAVRLFTVVPSTIDATAILDVAGQVTVVVVPLLIIGAVASQLSAAVADTVGGGQMLTGSLRHSRSARSGYVAVIGAAIVLVWVSDVFAIVSLASRAFAAYYLVQTIQVLIVVAEDRGRPRRTLTLAGFAVLAVVLAFVVVFAVPAG